MIPYETREELLLEYAEFAWGLCREMGDPTGTRAALRAYLLGGTLSQSEWELCAALADRQIYFLWGAV